MEIIAAIVTLLIGIGTSVIFGNWINWWSAGAVFAVATMGILFAIRRSNKK